MSPYSLQGHTPCEKMPLAMFAQHVQPRIQMSGLCLSFIFLVLSQSKHSQEA